MDVVCKVERRRSTRQIDDFSFGGERVDAVLEELGAHSLNEVRIGAGARPGIAGSCGGGAFTRLQEPAHPLDLPLVLGVARTSFLVGPVSGHAQLGMLMHLARADLHLDALPLRTDDGRVNGAVEISLGRRYVVVELAGDVCPHAVHHPERGITVRNARDDDAHRPYVEDLLERKVLALHLAVDAVHVLGAAVDLRADGGFAQLVVQVPAQRVDVALTVGALLVERCGDAAVFVGLEIPERKILELPLELPHAQAVGQWRKDGPGLHGEPFPLLVMQVARVPQAHELFREPRQHQAGIAHDRQKHLAQHLRLPGVEALGRRPIARQPQLAEPQQRGGGLDCLGVRHARQRCLGKLAALPVVGGALREGRFHEDGRRELHVLRE